jgi:outer membrane protein TolC
MRMPAPILTVLAVTLLMSSASSQEKPKERREESAKKVRELQKERIETLKELVDHAATSYKSGVASYEELLEASMMLLKAELDVAEKDSDRITLYKKGVDALKEYEDFAKMMKSVGKGTGAAVLKIKAMRLEVEIALEQAKAKEAKEK